MAKRSVVVAGLPLPGGPYSQVMVAGGFVFTAGLSPRSPSAGEIPQGIVAQTERVLDNLELALASVGAGLADLVKTTVHLSDLARDFAAFNEAYRRRVPEPFPVRTTVGSILVG